MAKRGLTEVERAARQQLGFARLRPGQEEAVRAALAGRDTLVVQPTGSGKSAIYQCAGLLLEGASVIVSPLIALQKDQADSIASQPHDAEAAVVNSTLPAGERRATLAKAAEGEVEFLFLAPEQLRKPEIVAQLRRAAPSLFVVDEAHCISEWGHDFRPDYLALGSVIEELGHPAVLAMTATAAPRVRQEIVERLKLRDPAIFVRGFDRPNLQLRVDTFQSEEEKLETLVRRVRFAGKPGIVYAATRKNAAAVVAALRDGGVDALLYHGGLKAADRRRIQDCFMNGGSEVMAATNAFGMGVDKPDVRFVFHFDISDSIDSYYQEIGRAGRDGAPAEAVLFYRAENAGLRRFQAGGGRLERGQVAAVAGILRREPEKPAAAIARELGISARKAASIRNRLEEVGPEGDAAGRAVDAQERLRAAQRERVETMQRYAELTTCRRKFLLNYFGEKYEGPCGACDNDGGARMGEPAGTRREVA